MSKKSKKKSKSKYFGNGYGYGPVKKSKGNKKSLKKATRGMKTVKSTLSKKDSKANKRMFMKPVKVPKELLKNRAKCNHAGDTISIQKFESMNANASAYTPMLGLLREVFGDEHIQICKDCYEAVVSADQVDVKTAKEALAVLYAACGIVVANVRMKDDEVKAVNRLKGIVEDFGPVLEFLEELEEKGSRNASASDGSDLNSVGMEVNV